MDTFGLGLVLDFTDNASGGMQSAMGTLNQLNSLASQTVDNSDKLNFSVMALSGAGAGLGVVGSQLMSFGGRLTSTMTGAVSSINAVGTQLLSARSQLGTLYGSMEQGEEIIEKAKKYAQTSIFNFEDLLPSIIMLKANGIEAFDKIASSTGKANQTLMDYAADLAAFNPQMRNAYGTGIQAAMGALNEYIAEGNKKSLKSGASLDITALLGEDTGKTIEERSRQVADLLEKLNMVGAVANMAGTASQRLSNVEDIFFNLKSMISDAGVYDAYTEVVQKLTSSLLEEFTTLEDGTQIQNKFFISTEMWQNFANVISKAVVSIMEPIKNLAAKLSELLYNFVNFVNEHPKMAKILIILTTVAGVATVVTGAILKLTGSFFQLIAGFLQTAKLMQEGISLGGMLRNSLGALNSVLLPLAAAAILVYEVWDKNIFGLRDVIKQAFGEIADIISITFDALADNKLSYEQFDKARKLGIMPFIEAMLQLKHHIGHLFDGFKAGFSGFFSTISSTFDKIKLVDGYFYKLSEKVGKFFDKFTKVGADKTWEKIGSVIGTVVGALTTALPIIKAVKIAIGFFSGPLGIIASVIGLIGVAWKKNLGGIREKLGKVVEWFKNIDWAGIFDKIMQAIQPILDWLGSIDWGAVWETVLGTIKSVWEWVEPLIKTIGETFKALFDGIFKQDNGSDTQKLFDFSGTNEQFGTMTELADGVGKALEKPTTLFGTLVDSIKVVAGVIKDLLPLVKTVFTAVRDVVTKVVKVLNKYIIPVVSKIVTKVLALVNKLVKSVSPLIQKLVKWVTDAWNGWLGDLVQEVIEFVGVVVDAVGEIVSWIIDVLGPVIEIIVDRVTQAVDSILEIVMPVVDAIGAGLSMIVGVLSGVIEFIVGIFTGDWEKAWNGVCKIFTSLWDGLVNIFKSIINALIAVVNVIIKGLNLLKVPDWVPGIGGFGINIPEIPYLSTGGEIKGEGVSYLHPNEVVVNSETTNGLRDFLSDYKNGSAGMGEEIVSSFISENRRFLNNLQTIMCSVGNAIISAITGSENAAENTFLTTTNNNSNIDNSIGSITTNTINNSTTPTKTLVTPNSGDNFTVTFAAGSIVIQSTGEIEGDLNKLADKLAKILKRKMDLKQMAVRS